MPFSESQKRFLLVSFQHMDKLLAEASANLAVPEGDRLFLSVVPDASPAQRRVISDYLVSFRSIARQFLSEHQLSAKTPQPGGLWSFRTALDFVWVALAEIDPRHLAGYGSLDPQAAHAVERVTAQLHPIIQQVSEYLQQGLGGDIANRLQRLDQTRDEVALLRELERIVSDHGLVEFRSTIAWILERFERPWLEVAFFGRVSCGKSSLVNALLGRDVLPTGVTPVTAVPTRIVPGSAAAATVAFARASAQRIGLDRLGEFVSEDGNPGNEKRVVDILVELSASLLRDGVCLVDTPGLGSLATAGAEESMAYLPRCDIGVLLVDAAGALRAEDITVARAILESGALLITALSKSDLIAPADVEKMTRYVQAQLRAALAVDVTVRPMSVAREGPISALSWFQAELAPRLDQRRSLLGTSLRRKVGALREAVTAALDVKAHHDGRRPSSSADRSKAAESLSGARAALARCRDRAARLAEALPDRRAVLVDGAANAVVGSWQDYPRRTDSRQAGDQAAICLARAVNRVGDEISTVLEEARQSLEQGLAGAARAMRSSRSDDGDLDGRGRLDGRPLFDPQHLFRDVRLRPGFWGHFGAAAAKASVRRQLEQAMGASLVPALESHSGALKRWALEALKSLERGFDASAAPFSDFSRTAAPPNDEAGARSEADLQMLRQWDGSSPA